MKVDAVKKTDEQQFNKIPDLRKPSARGRENDNKIGNYSGLKTKGPRPFTATYNIKSQRNINRPTTGVSYGPLDFKMPKIIGRSARAASALPNVCPDPRFGGYDAQTIQLKKLLGIEKQNVRFVRTLMAKEIAAKSIHEKLLRTCVEDV